MNDKKRAIVNIAFTYIGTVVGAGFASGKEIVEFFTRFGALGFFSILLTGLFFIIGGIKLMIISKRIHAKSYQDLNFYLFGPFFGQIVNWLFLIILIGTTSVILSGAGAVFNEQLGFSYYVGIGLTLILCFFVIIKGVKSIFVVNNFVVPMMITFSAILAFFSIDALQALCSPSSFIVTPLQWEIFVTPFTYAALNLGLAQAVLVPIAGEIKDESVLK
jgi:uncharacterized membrane protein YkvI